MILEHPGLFLDRLQSASNGPGILFVKVTPGPSRIAIIVPEAMEACLDRPDSGHLQVGLFEFTELLGEGFIEMRFIDQPVKFGACQTLISGCLECFVLLATHFIDGLIEVLANVKPIMHNIRLRQLFLYRMPVRFPYVHSDSRDLLLLFWCQWSPSLPRW